MKIANSLIRVVLAVLVLASQPVFAQQTAYPATNEPAASPADPAAVGMSSARLQRLADFLAAEVVAGRLPGAVVAVSRRGQTVFLQAHGVRDDETHEPMALDSIFDLSTLTQPITAVGALVLHERGRWLLSDHLGAYLPEFGKRPISILDLLRQSSGLAGTLPAQRRTKKGALQNGSSSIRYSLEAAARLTGTEFVNALSRAGPARPVGLVSAPGFSYDALGLAIEAASKQTLGTWLLREIFIPLDLWDTGFNPSSKVASRLVRPPANAGLDAHPITGWVPVRDLTGAVSFECGGACLSSTAQNYLRFVRMLLNNGSLDGKRILSRASVQYMITNRLRSEIENRLGVPDEISKRGQSRFGYGLGVSVRPPTVYAALPGSPGEFSVAAPTGPYFWADQHEQLAVVLLALVPDPLRRLRLHRQVRALVRQAIDD